MNELKIGDKVMYHPSYGKPEKGILKSFSVKEDYAFAVYHCAKEWDRYFDYTGASTRMDELTKGWEE